jgi:site-specific DNA-methyltransferase (adenine-specific)
MVKRRKKYIPGLAQLNFKPDEDWEIEEARESYEKANFPIKSDEIIYSDCISGMQKLPDSCIDLIIANPPFGIEFDGKGSQYNRDEDLVVDGYQEIEEDYDTFTQKWISKLPRIMKETASAFIFSGWSNLSDILNALKKSDLTTINHIIWKYQFGVFTRNKFVTSHYHVLFVVKNEKNYYFNKIEHYPLDIWEINRTYSPGEKKNSTKLPLEVVTRCIDFCSRPGDLIFDPFMGNGTTAICAKANFRHYLGFEMNKNLQKIIQTNLNDVKIGENYKPYYTYLPSKEEIIEKYPHLKKYIDEKDISTKKDTKKQKNLLEYT